MSQQGKKDFTFINEHIKTKPFYKKKWFLKTGAAVGLAVVFGAVAGLTFGIITPWAKQKFGEPQTPTQIVIAQEEETDKPAEKPTEKPTDAAVTEKESEIIPQTVIEEKALNLSDYKKLYSQMYSVAREAQRAVVTVTGSSSNVDLFNEPSENNVEASGLIVAANGAYMYVLTESAVIESAERLRVTFPDATTVDADLQKQDPTTEMALVRLPISKIPEETKNLIDTSALASSCSVAQGAPVIAIGSPLGYTESIAFGMVTSILPTSVEDREYNMINTDIIGSSEGSGILVNLDGKIVGVITRDFSNQAEQSTVTGVSISEIRQMIENMTNNVEMAYMGIIGKEVTESIQKESHIPEGVYVKEIAADSPAMYAGIQKADILISINGEKITNMKQYSDQLGKLKPEEIAHVLLMRQGMDGNYAEIPADVTLGNAQ